MEITEVSRKDQASLLAIAREAIAMQVLPHLCALGQATMLGAMEREAAKVVDGCSYHVRKAVVGEST